MRFILRTHLWLVRTAGAPGLPARSQHVRVGAVPRMTLVVSFSVLSLSDVHG